MLDATTPSDTVRAVWGSYISEAQGKVPSVVLGELLITSKP